MNKVESSKTTTQYLFFIMDGEKYAINAKDVQEIVDYINITKVPKTNESVKGITNIRGELIPVVDPKIRFNIGETEISKRTAFIILNLLNKEKNSTIAIALIVDIVIEVDDIKEDDILPTPEFGTKIDQRYIENIIRENDEYVSVLNIDTVLSISELSVIG